MFIYQKQVFFTEQISSIDSLCTDKKYFYLWQRKTRTLYKMTTDFELLECYQFDIHYKKIKYDFHSSQFIGLLDSCIHLFTLDITCMQCVNLSTISYRCGKIQDCCSTRCNKLLLTTTYALVEIEVCNPTSYNVLCTKHCDPYKSFQKHKDKEVLLSHNTLYPSRTTCCGKYPICDCYCCKDLLLVKDCVYVVAKDCCCIPCILLFTWQECCCNKEPCDHDCDSIIHSIAHVECALANILHGEGQKIQCAVAKDASIPELLAINQSVNDTISNVSQVENLLVTKLKQVKKD